MPAASTKSAVYSPINGSIGWFHSGGQAANYSIATLFMSAVNEHNVTLTPPAGKPISPSRVLRLAQPDPTLREKIRARLIDDNLDPDRRLIGEPVPVPFRCLFLLLPPLFHTPTPP